MFYVKSRQMSCQLNVGLKLNRKNLLKTETKLNMKLRSKTEAQRN